MCVCKIVCNCECVVLRVGAGTDVGVRMIVRQGVNGCGFVCVCVCVVVCVCVWLCVCVFVCVCQGVNGCGELMLVWGSI